MGDITSLGELLGGRSKLAGQAQEVRATGSPGSATWLEESCQDSLVTTFRPPQSYVWTLSLSWGFEEDNPLSPVGRWEEPTY